MILQEKQALINLQTFLTFQVGDKFLATGISEDENEDYNFWFVGEIFELKSDYIRGNDLMCDSKSRTHKGWWLSAKVAKTYTSLKKITKETNPEYFL